MISTPKIDTDLLWGLSALFAIVAVIYGVLVFYFRNKISKNSKKVREKKKEFSPMISEFLFYDESGKKEEKINYIDLKIQIRELIKDQFDRKVLTEVLMDLRKDVSGTTRDELFHIYQDLELHKDAYKKLKSWRWEVVSKGIFELTQMNVVASYGLITNFINDKRPTIRKQAELAAVTLKEEGISYFLDNTKYKISEWQQLKLLDVLKNKEDFLPPPFRLWLTSKNNYVVLFALRLIKHYNQNDARTSLIQLIKHKNNHIKTEAISCIREFNIVEALPVMKMVFRQANVGVKMSILDAIAQIGSVLDIDFLKTVYQKESTFIVKSKAVSALNTISPESVMPTKDVETDEELESNTAMAYTPENNFKKDTDSSEHQEKTKGLNLNDIDVNFEIKEPISDTKQIASLVVDSEEINIDFIPVVIADEADNKSSLSEKNDDDEKSLETIQVEYEEVKIDKPKTSINIDFLPLVVAPDSSADTVPRDFNVVFEKVLDIRFDVIGIDNIEMVVLEEKASLHNPIDKGIENFPCQKVLRK